MAILDPKRQQELLEEQRGRLSQGFIDDFLRRNPNDYHRLAEQPGDLPQTQTAPSPSLEPRPMPDGWGGNPALDGLLAAGPTSLSGMMESKMGQAAPQAQGQVSMPLIPNPPMSGAEAPRTLDLRPNLGIRRPAQVQGALAALQRIY